MSRSDRDEERAAAAGAGEAGPREAGPLGEEDATGGRSRSAAVWVLLWIVGLAGLGLGVIKVVDALEADADCGSYGYGGYGNNGGYGGYGCPPVRGDAAITVDPATGLVDRQTVTVRGVRFDPNTLFGAALCGREPRSRASERRRLRPPNHVDRQYRFRRHRDPDDDGASDHPGPGRRGRLRRRRRMHRRCGDDPRRPQPDRVGEQQHPVRPERSTGTAAHRRADGRHDHALRRVRDGHLQPRRRALRQRVRAPDTRATRDPRKRFRPRHNPRAARRRRRGRRSCTSLRAVSVAAPSTTRSSGTPSTDSKAPTPTHRGRYGSRRAAGRPSCPSTSRAPR